MPSPEPTRCSRALHANLQPVRLVVNLLRGRPGDTPTVQMNPYPMNEVLPLLTRNGIHEAHFSFSNDSGFEGALIVARKRVEAGVPV